MKITITKGGPAVNGNLISVYMCSKYGDSFPKCVRSIVDSSTSPNYEIVVKVDSIEEQKHRQSILNKLGVKYTMVLSGAMGYENLHVMHNQAVAAASGDLFWGIGDDCWVSGDWHGAFREVQKKNPDNIFVINTSHRTWSVCPVVSRGWYEILGYVSASPTNDFFLKTAADACHRYLHVSSQFNLKITHDQMGKVGIPKSIRKPALRIARRRARGASRLIKKALRKYREETRAKVLGEQFKSQKI